MLSAATNAKRSPEPATSRCKLKWLRGRDAVNTDSALRGGGLIPHGTCLSRSHPRAADSRTGSFLTFQVNLPANHLGPGRRSA
jgi:hypothetical protein